MFSVKGLALPTYMEDLGSLKIVKVKAGAYSAALSNDAELYVWGKGMFGTFSTPHKIKAGNQLEINDFELSLSGLAAVLTRHGQIYTWGSNEIG